ncbi:MAG: GtrA family protein [Lachnospiraceae bacterium]|jgi:putative flippase GtrA|nr:GtrA family protein [Lachnospiraceae bacterium]MDD7327140.1 GtrA family protein [Lachnospiraceae bacterium]MDY2759869.1 GtrA family protein [Lachnospiraceae bacterium]
MLKPADWLDRIFDSIFTRHPKSRKVEPLYHKYKELMLYGMFGLGTFIIALFTYWLFTEPMHMHVLVGNALSWIFATAFAFITNRYFVFYNHTSGVFAFFYQLGAFCVGRVLTLGIEELMLGILIGAMHLPNMLIKVLAQIVVITLNYVFSKIFVFKKE